MAPSPLPQRRLPFIQPGEEGPSLPWYQWFQRLSLEQGGEGPPGPPGPQGAPGADGSSDDVGTGLAIAALDGTSQSAIGGGGITFGIADGSTGTSVTLPALATRASALSVCLVQVVASDGAIDLTFVVNQNGASIFSSPPTITHGVSPGQYDISASLVASPTGVSVDDVFTMDITSGSSTWKVTVALG